MTTRVHFHTDCYAFSGSETTLMLLLADAIDRDDVDVAFTYRSSPAYDAGLARHLDPRVPRLPMRLPDPIDITDRRRRRTAIALGARQWCFAYDVVRLWRILRASRPDVLHVNNGGLPGAISCNAAAVAGRLAGVSNIVYVVNNVAHTYARPARWLDYPVDRLVARSVTRFVTGSAAAGSALRRVLRLTPKQHVVVPNGVAARVPGQSAAATRAAHGIDADASVIAVVARLEERKGHRHLLDAVASLPTARRLSTHLLVAGDGPEREALEKQAASLGITHRLTFLGDHPDPWSLYEVADVVVLPSVANEDLPIVIIEAMAAGRPVVATRVAGSGELVEDGVTGTLVPPADAAALAAAIDRLLDDAELRRRLGAAASARYERSHTPGRVVDRYRTLYAGVTP